MPCVFRVTDKILSAVLGKSEFNSISELRDAFDSLANKSSVIPVNIVAKKDGKSEDFSRRKYAKVYKDDISEGIKVQIVMPGAEFLDRLSFGRGLIHEPEFYGTHDTKVLTFESIDNFLAFYLANYLFVDTVDNLEKLTKSLESTLARTLDRIDSPDDKVKVFAIEDLNFATSLVEYGKILYEQAGKQIPDTLNEFYEKIKEKVDKYHGDKRDDEKTKIANKKNTEKVLPIPQENLVYFDTYDVVVKDGVKTESDKQGAKLRRELVRGIKDPTQYRIKLSKGSTEYYQDPTDQGVPLTEAQANSGVVGILVDLEGNPVYLSKEGLTTDLSSARRFKYKIEEQEKESPVIYLLLPTKQYGKLKEDFLNSNNPDSFVFNVHATKIQGEYEEKKSFKESGYDLTKVTFNDLKNEPYAGVAYLVNNDRRVIVNPTTLTEDEIQEIVPLLQHTYEDQNELIKVVKYLNDLISVSDKRVRESNGMDGREISVLVGVDRIYVLPQRVKEGDKFVDVDSPPIYFEENPDLVLNSLRSARVRLAKEEGENKIKLGWNKYLIKDGELIERRVNEKDSIEFYENHLSSIATQVFESTQLITYSERVISKKKPVIGMLQIEKGKEYTLGEIRQLLFTPLTNPVAGDDSNRIKQKEYFRQLMSAVYNLSDTKFVFEDFIGSHPDTYGRYDPNTKVTHLHYSNIMKMRDNFKMVNGIVEEILHNVTLNRLPEYKETEEFQRLEEDYERAKELRDTYKQHPDYLKLDEQQKKDLDFNVNYYLQNIEEFIVGISNPHFRFFLKLGESRDKNLLDKVIESIKKLLNRILKDVAPSLYTDVTTDLFNFLLSKPTEIKNIVEKKSTQDSKQQLENVQKLKPTDGWKIHLSVDVTNRDILSDFLKQEGFLHKVGRNADQEGKDITIYVGSKDRLIELSTKLKQQFNELLLNPKGDVLIDDTLINDKVAARFDISTDPLFHQYGKSGVPVLKEDALQSIVEKSGYTPEMISRADKILSDKYGTFYTGSNEINLTENIQISEVDVEPVKEQQKEKPKKKLQKKEQGELNKYYSAPIKEEIDLVTVRGVDAEVAQYLMNSGQFGKFVQGELNANEVWVRVYNSLVDEYETSNDDERIGWIEYFTENENEIKKAWAEKSKLFAFSNDKLYIGEDLVEDEGEESPEEMESKDPGYNAVDNEQSKTRLELADKFAKMFVKLTPMIDNGEVVMVKGMIQLADFTVLWNKLQRELEGTLGYDEQLFRLNSETVQGRIPEASLISERLEMLSDTPQDILILNSIQNSLSAVKAPVWFPIFKEGEGYEYSYFEQASLDAQNIELNINNKFREFSKRFAATTINVDGNEVPTVDNKKLAQHLKSAKSLKDKISIYREMGFDIPENTTEFVQDSKFGEFDTKLISLLEKRDGNAYIMNREFTSYIKSNKLWETPWNTLETSEGISTSFNQVISEISKTSKLTVSNMTHNAEGQNQSILLSWSSWMINLKRLNQGESFRSKNPIYKYSLLAKANELNPVTPLNLSGSMYFDGLFYEGKTSMNLDYTSYLRQEIASYVTRGWMEISRVETKNSTFGYKFKWEAGMHPIPLKSFQTDAWEYDAVSIFLSNNQDENPKGYLRGEIERIQRELNNPVTYYKKYDKIKTDFHLFTYLPDSIKQDKTLPFKEFYQKHKGELKMSLLNDIKKEVDAFKLHVLKQTGQRLTKNHPILNVPQVQKKIKEELKSLDKFLTFLVVNRRIYQLEHAITGHGDIGQQDKYYKRSGSNISTGVPVILNSKLLTTLTNTLDRTFTGVIPTGRSITIPDDVYSYEDENFKEGVKESLTASYKAFGIDKTPAEIEEDTNKKVKPYQLGPEEIQKGVNVADGQGFMTPDFGRMIMMATQTWNSDREDGFWFKVIKHKQSKGITLTKDELTHLRIVNQKIKDNGRIYWNFPSLKFQYRGPFYLKTETNVQLEGLDKFSLAWLWPDEQVGKKFGPILESMMEQGVSYGKFESGTKIATPIPDDLIGMVERGEVLTLNSIHDIDLQYFKEQVKAGEGFKNKIPMSTQAKKLIVSNLRTDTPKGRAYLNEAIKEGVRKWKESQDKISEDNKKKLMDEISTDGAVDNNKLAEKIREQAKKRELPESLTAVFDYYGIDPYTRFEHSLSPQLVETLISSLLKNNIVKSKYPGEHYIQVASTIYDNVGQRDLNFYQYESILSPEDKIIFGHPGIGKSFLKEKGDAIISVDDDYKSEINAFIDEKRGSQTRQEYKSSNKEEYNNLLKDIWNRAKKKAKKENKLLFVSNLPILRMFPNDFDKFISMSKETFIQRSKDRNDYKQGYTEDWKNSIDLLLASVDQSKIIVTSKYLSEILTPEVLPAECKITLSGQFLNLLNLKEVNDNLPPEYNELREFEKFEYKRYVLNQLLLIPEFVESNRRALTVYSSRIPGQGFNSMDIFIIKEFLPTYDGPVIVLPPQATKKSGTDFDYDKLPTITPELNKEGNISKSRVNQMIKGAKEILLDPINFHRLVTPNSTDELDGVIKTTLDRLGVTVTEPKFDSIFYWTSHLDKWLAMKMKNPLGIGAVNNTFYTLEQDADVTINKTFQVVPNLTIPSRLPFKTEDKPFYYPLVKDVDKLEYINQFINITVDVASNDAIGYTGLKQENSGLLLFLIERGVSFKDAFYFINQPIIFRYHQLLDLYQGRGMTSAESKREVIANLLGVLIKKPRNYYGVEPTRNWSDIYSDIYDFTNDRTFGDLEKSIVPLDQIPSTFNITQKSYLAFYLIGLEMAEKQREAQQYNNFDTSPSASYFYSEMRERLATKIKESGLFNLDSIKKIHNDSVISHLNAHEEFGQIVKEAFKIAKDPLFIQEAIKLGEMIYSPTDRDKFFRKFSADYLLSIIQNFGTIKYEGKLDILMERWNKIKDKEGKDLIVTKYITPNYSKTGIAYPSLFLGLDNDAQTLNQIAKDLRVLHDNPDTRQWVIDFIEVGLYTTGFTKSPTYYLNALPFELVTPYLKEAFDNYTPSQEYIQAFSRRFRYQRGMEFSQYFLDLYKAEAIKNLKGKEKQKYFNQEAWRYTDYRLTLPEKKTQIKVNTYSGRINSLQENQVFVFGSNPLGINGNPSKGTGGAALVAYNIAGVKQGEKMDNKLSDSGKAWGITTVSGPGQRRSKTPEQIKQGIKKLYDHAIQNPNKEFLIAYQGKTGSNLNGYTNQELADMFSAFEIPDNVLFETEFSTLLTLPETKQQVMGQVTQPEQTEEDWTKPCDLDIPF